MSKHFTAWLTIDPTALCSDICEIDVIEDVLKGEDEWVSEGSVQFSAFSNLKHTEVDGNNVTKDATTILFDKGWNVVSDWESVTTGCIATVERI